jgi:hypothetical protein
VAQQVFGLVDVFGKLAQGTNQRRTWCDLRSYVIHYGRRHVVRRFADQLLEFVVDPSARWRGRGRRPTERESDVVKAVGVGAVERSGNHARRRALVDEHLQPLRIGRMALRDSAAVDVLADLRLSFGEDAIEVDTCRRLCLDTNIDLARPTRPARKRTLAA